MLMHVARGCTCRHVQTLSSSQFGRLTVPVVVELKCRFCPKMPATMETKANMTVMITTICKPAALCEQLQ